MLGTIFLWKSNMIPRYPYVLTCMVKWHPSSHLKAYNAEKKIGKKRDTGIPTF